MHQLPHAAPIDETKVVVKVSGMHCTNCALSLEKHLLKVGAHAPNVDFATGRASFTLHDSHRLTEVVKSISNLGYAVDESTSSHSHEHGHSGLELKTAVSAILTLPLLIAMFVPHSFLHDPTIQFYLSTPVFLIGLHHFGLSAIRSLRAGVANMDVLIAIGIIAGYVASVISLFQGLSHETIFFEATASIVTFVLIGNVLEERAVRKTTSAIENLSALQPEQATKLVPTSNGSYTSEVVPVATLSVGDLLQVNTGDRIPADSAIEQGNLSCDESMLTGESLPVERAEGERLIGGSIAVGGTAVVRVTAVGSDSTLASIVRLVQEAQQRKPSIQRLGDAVSAVFVPGVIAVSVIILGLGIFVFDLSISQAIVRALAIAVVACPCAMGLATPTAIMVALGRAATSGFLIRGGDTLERLAKIKHIAFDKTGTLTRGALTLGKLSTHNGASENEARSALAALQLGSSHPIAKAIVSAYKEFQGALSLREISETRGVGIEGIDSLGARYVCGGKRIAARFGVSTSDDLVLIKDGVLLASLSLRDELRPEAVAVITKLRALGITVSMISGDQADKCAEAAAELGITEVHSEKLPEEKLAVIRELQSHAPIAYVGDGINDAPTLAEASVGVSLSSASDVARHSAQVVLTGNTLAALPATISLARLTVQTIKQNLFWAFFYNLTAIPLAALGYIAPLAGALMMTASDVVIVANSLQIKLRRLRGA
jgi:Cu+-exporting ATPase